MRHITSTKFSTRSHPSFNSMTLVLNDPSWWPYINVARIGSNFAVVACAALIYDWVLKLGQEVELIWRQHWSLMTILYLSVRYLGIIYVALNILLDVPTIPLTDAVSQIVYLAQEWVSIIVNAMLGVIIITRLNAMYQRSSKVLILLVVVFLAVNIACAVLGGVSMRGISGEELILSGTYQCHITYEVDSQHMTVTTWILCTIWEVLALCLALWIAVKHFREVPRHSAAEIIGDCFTVLMRTHVIYFASFVVVSSLGFAIFFSPGLGNPFSLEAQIYDEFLQFFISVQTFVLGPRLVLGVREYHAKLMADSDAATGMTSIAFEERVHVSTSSSV
ncbi:hypothetical protein DFH29DRAFT_1080397 [Suillus ampliporus]|nr:hypothetical protein DFH29DRAFT_1080397 [Suillus ampliporus]